MQTTIGKTYGTDVSCEHLDLTAHGTETVTRIKNEAAAIKRWLKTVPAGSRLAMESTGRYHLMLATLAYEAGVEVYVLNPRDVRHYARGVGCRGKTDPMDARVVARYLAREYSELHAWAPPPPAHQQLSELGTKRALLVKQVTGMRQSANGSDIFDAVIAAANATVKAIDRQIAQIIKQLPQASRLACMMSIPGIGLISGTALMVLFERLQGVSIDTVVGFTGLDPAPKQSGKHSGRRHLSKKGPSEIRRLLYSAAMSASQTTAWHAFYTAQRDKGLPRTAALVVLARKILRVAYTLYRTETTFMPSPAAFGVKSA